MRWLRWRRDRKQVSVEFCDSCGTVCDDQCRSDKLREESRDWVVRHGWTPR